MKKSLALFLLLFTLSNVSLGQATDPDNYSFEAFVVELGRIHQPDSHTWYTNKTFRRKVISRLDYHIDKLSSAYTFENYGSFDPEHPYFMAQNTLMETANNEDLARKEKEEAEVSLWQQTFETATLYIQYLQTFSGLYSNDITIEEIKKYLSEIYHPRTLQFLYLDYETRYNKNELRMLYNSVAKRNLTEIAHQLDQMEERTFSMYQSNMSSNDKIKSIDLFHANDIFTDFSLLGFNQDREMTGGFALTVATDYFKARFFNMGWAGYIQKNDSGKLRYNKEAADKPRSQVLSYQSLSFGGSGFTPYIRYRNNYALADTFHFHDRPFGSYVFLARNKYRLWPSGLLRQKGSFQIGQIGLSSGDKIQATIHKDMTVLSQRVYGWDKQVASGGRFLIQMEQDWDFLLFSNTNDFVSVLKPRSRYKEEIEGVDTFVGYTHAEALIRNQDRKYSGNNIILNLEGKWGGYMTSVGAGLRYSTLDFLNQSGENSLVPKQRNAFDFGIRFDCGLQYRYVVHNSMLEGLGYIRTFINDEYDEDNSDFYVLNQKFYNDSIAQTLGTNAKGYPKPPKELDQLNRNVFMFDWGLTLQWRRMAFYIKQTYYTLEYDISPLNYDDPSITSLVHPSDSDFYENTIKPQHVSIFDRKIYGYGTLGATWLLNN